MKLTNDELQAILTRPPASPHRIKVGQLRALVANRPTPPELAAALAMGDRAEVLPTAGTIQALLTGNPTPEEEAAKAQLAANQPEPQPTEPTDSP